MPCLRQKSSAAKRFGGRCELKEPEKCQTINQPTDRLINTVLMCAICEGHEYRRTKAYRDTFCAQLKVHYAGISSEARKLLW